MNRRAFGVWFLLAFTVEMPAMAIEEVKYTVIGADGSFELRDYPSYRVVQTFVDGRFEDVGDEGFRRLFAYISGANKTTSKIPMTAPVEQQSSALVPSVKIPMTAPVEQQAVGDRWRIAFVLPASYTRDTAPQPTDERVQIAEVPPHRVVAVRYRGSWSRSRFEEHLAQLRGFLAGRGMTPVGEPIWDRYDPPFMPWFLRRNEIRIAVQDAPGAPPGR
jgi:hypothetical protein